MQTTPTTTDKGRVTAIRSVTASRESRTDKANIRSVTAAEPRWTRLHYLKTRRWTETADVEIAIDLHNLFAMLGAQALRNKGGKAVECGGLVQARVVGARKETDIRIIDNPLREGEEIAS